MDMQKLIPLNVPWQISAGDASLRLSFAEQGGTAIEFLALLGHGMLEQDLLAGMIPYLASAYLGSVAKQTPFHMVSVSFSNLASLRGYPFATAAFDKTTYDCSAIPSLTPEDKSQTVHAYDFKKHWNNNNKRCPDPGAYTVENSSWIVALGLSPFHYKHYIFLGQHAFIEVVAADMHWMLQKPVFYRG